MHLLFCFVYKTLINVNSRRYLLTNKRLAAHTCIKILHVAFAILYRKRGRCVDITFMSYVACLSFWCEQSKRKRILACSLVAGRYLGVDYLLRMLRRRWQ